jgi:DnaJ-class molecular chaperone
MTKDPYQILGVSRTSSQDEIKQAYRRLAKQHHPDRNPNDRNAERRFKEVQAAYEVLGDPDKRTQYDRFGAGGPRPDYQEWTSGPGFNTNFDVHFGGDDLTSIFEQFFSRGAGVGTGGRQRGKRRPARGADIEMDVTLNFEEAIKGAVREVVLATEGADQRERIRFRVPAGVEDGQTVRVPGKGQGRGSGRGDLVVRVHVQPHPQFRREGLDLFVDLWLSFPEALLGAEVEVPTLDGTARLKIPPGTPSGTKLRLRGRGVEDVRSGRTGDLYAVIRIDAPRTLTPRARELVEALRDELAEPRRGRSGART